MRFALPFRRWCDRVVSERFSGRGSIFKNWRLERTVLSDNKELDHSTEIAEFSAMSTGDDRYKGL